MTPPESGEQVRPVSAPAIEYGPKTIDDFDALPEDQTRRYELIDGEIIVTSRPAVLHQDVMAELLVALRQALPRGYRVVTEVAVGFDDRRQGCVPDLLVTRPGTDRRRPHFHSDDVVLAVEIISGSGRHDRDHKRRIYAAGGIQNYWMVELEPFRVLAHQLAGHWYGAATAETDDELVVTEPFKATVDLRAARLAAEGGEDDER